MANIQVINGNNPQGVLGTAGDTDTFTDFSGSAQNVYTIANNLAGDVVINDNDGCRIVLSEGFDPTSVEFYSQAVVFTVNGHTVTVNTADPEKLTFTFAGEMFDPAVGETRTLAQTAEAYGVTLPGEGEDPVTVDDPGPVQADGAVAPYTLGADMDAVDEGSTVTFTLTTDLDEGTEVPLTISGIDAAADVEGDLPTAFTIGADGTATVSVTLAADATTEGAETLSMSVEGAGSVDVTVNDTSVTPPPTDYTLSANVTEATNEGDTVTFTLDTSGAETPLAEGDEVALTISGIDAADVDGDLPTVFTIGADGTASVSVTLAEDMATEGAETLSMSVEDAGSVDVTVNDTSVTPLPTDYTLSATAPSFNEGTSMTYTVMASEAVAADTTFTWALSGTGANAAGAADFSSATSGTVTIAADSTSATFSVAAVAADGAEFAETFTVTLTDSTGAAVDTVTTTINDTSTTYDAEAPVVAADQAFDYTENQTAGDTVATVAASDNMAVTGYAIASGDADDYFAIDASGNISLTEAGAAAATNDYEATPNSFTLGVTASDAFGNVSEAADVTLEVENVDDTPPAVTSAVIDGNQVTLNFGEALDTTAGSPGTTDFTVTVASAGGGTGVNNVVSVLVEGTTVTLNLADPAAEGQTFTLAYTPGANALQDAAGNAVVAFSGLDVVTDTTAPVITADQTASYMEGTYDDTTDILYTVEASDAESNIADFAITSGNTDGYFAIDSTGNITLTEAGLAGAANDYEETPNSFTLAVEATDVAGNAATENVVVNVTNDTIDDADQPLELTLTNDTDAREGGSGDDTFIGDSASIDAADVLDGNAGDDTARLTLDDVVNESLTSREVETFQLQALVQALGGIATFNAVNVDDMTTLVNNDSDSDLTVTNLQNQVGLEVNGGEGANFSVDFAATATLTSPLSVELTDARVGDLILPDDAFSSITIQTTGTTGSSVTDLVEGVGDDLDTLTSLTFTGDQMLTITNELENVTTFTATENSGGVRVVIDDDEDVTFAGGSGNDRVDVQATDLDVNDNLNGGTGTDTLRIADGDMMTETGASNVQGFEVLETTNAAAETFNVDNIIANNALTGVTVNSTADVTVNNINAGALGNIDILSDGVHDVTLTAKNFTSGGSSDTATITLDNDVNDHANGVDVGALTFAGLDVLNLVSVKSSEEGNQENSIANLVASDLETINISGDADVSLTTDATTDAVTEVNASALTEDLTLDLSADDNGGGVLVVGGVGDDLVAGTSLGTTTGDTYQMGAGDDTVRIDGDVGGLRDTFRYTATTLGSGDLSAGDGDVITGFVSDGDGVLDAEDDVIDLTSGVEGVLQFNGQTLGAASANVTLINGTTLGNNTNVAAVDNGNDLVLQIDLDGNGSFSATNDFSITLTDLAGQDVIYDATNDVFFVNGGTASAGGTAGTSPVDDEVAVPAAGDDVNIGSGNPADDTALPASTNAKEDMGSDTIALDPTTATGDTTITGFTLGTSDDADVVDFTGVYADEAALVADITSISAERSNTAYNGAFAAQDFVTFTVTFSSGHDVVLEDLIRYDSLDAQAQTILGALPALGAAFPNSVFAVGDDNDSNGTDDIEDLVGILTADGNVVFA